VTFLFYRAPYKYFYLLTYLVMYTITSGGARVSGIRGIDHFSSPSPLLLSPPLFLFPLEVGDLEVGPLNPAMGSRERCELPGGIWGKPQPPMILVHFEDVESLLMTSKMCIDNLYSSEKYR